MTAGSIIHSIKEQNIMIKTEKLVSIAKNQAEIHKEDGSIDLYSYSIKVARIESGRGYKTATYYSPTTARHIDAFFRRHGVPETHIKTVESV